MGQDRDESLAYTLLWFALLLIELAVYGVLFFGGIIATLYAMSWVDTNYLQPMVGGSDLLTLALFGLVQICYIIAFFRVTSSTTRQLPEKADSWTMFREQEP